MTSHPSRHPRSNGNNSRFLFNAPRPSFFAHVTRPIGPLLHSEDQIASSPSFMCVASSMHREPAAFSSTPGDPRARGSDSCPRVWDRTTCSSGSFRCFPLRSSPPNPGPRGTLTDRPGVVFPEPQRLVGAGSSPLSEPVDSLFVPFCSTGLNPILSWETPHASRLQLPCRDRIRAPLTGHLHRSGNKQPFTAAILLHAKTKPLTSARVRGC